MRASRVLLCSTKQVLSSDSYFQVTRNTDRQVGAAELRPQKIFV